MGNKIQQIIQHRKGCIDKVKDINSYLSEIIYGVGDIGDLRGNVVFIGNQNSGSGNYSPISKIYFGTNAPTINGYGKTLNGIPFYSVYDKTLYILNNPKNIDMDLSGNIYRRNISPNNISSSGYISGNSLSITGDVLLGKNDTNIIELNGKIKGSLIPLVSNTYDLGNPSLTWRNIYATQISGAFSGDGSNLRNINTSMSVELIGSSTNSYNLSLPNEKLTIYSNPENGIDLIMGSKRIEISPINSTYTQKGVSYYNSDDFILVTGFVSINYSKLNSLSSSFNDFTASFNHWTSSVYSPFSSSVNNQFSDVNSALTSLNNYTLSTNIVLNNFSVYTSSFQSTYDIFSSSVNNQFIDVNSALTSLNIASGSFFKQGGNSFGQSGSLGTNDNFSLVFKTNNINRIILGTDGKFTIGNVTSPTGLLNVGGDIISTGDIAAYSASDIRLKKNIKKIENASNLLSKLNGYTFDWNDKQSLYEDGKSDMGVIAQEVERIFPNIVGNRYDGYKSVKYDRLIPLLIEGFNQLRQEFEYLKTKL